VKKPVTITVPFPEELVEQLEEEHRRDPDFLGRVLLYGITRRSIYRHLRKAEKEEVSA